MKSDKRVRINNTVDIVFEILEKNKEKNENINELYKKAQKIKNNRDNE